MKNQMKKIIGIFIIVIGLSISYEIVNHFYNQGDIDGQFRVFYSEMWGLNDYVAVVIYSLLFSLGGGLLIINSSKTMIVFEIVLLGFVTEFIFKMNPSNYSYYWNLPVIIVYFLMIYERVGGKSKLFVIEFIIVTCLVTLVHLCSNYVMPEHFYNMLEVQFVPNCR